MIKGWSEFIRLTKRNHNHLPAHDRKDGRNRRRDDLSFDMIHQVRPCGHTAEDGRIRHRRTLVTVDAAVEYRRKADHEKQHRPIEFL